MIENIVIGGLSSAVLAGASTYAVLKYVVDKKDKVNLFKNPVSRIFILGTGLTFGVSGAVIGTVINDATNEMDEKVNHIERSTDLIYSQIANKNYDRAINSMDSIKNVNLKYGYDHRIIKMEKQLNEYIQNNVYKGEKNVN